MQYYPMLPYSAMANEERCLAGQYVVAAHKVMARLPQGIEVHYLILIHQQNLAVSTKHKEVL